jgi:leader peptidase (prepilin peptidase) / N-methyltransferase
VRLVIVIVAAVVGLAAGRWIAVAHRFAADLPDDEVEPDAKPASSVDVRCDACGRPVSPDGRLRNLRGRALAGYCRHCRRQVTRGSPWIELATAALLAGVAARFGWTAELPAYLYLAAIGVGLTVVDFRVHRLPDRVTLPSYGVGLALLGVAALAHGHPGWWVRALIGMAALYGFYFVLALVSPATGFGDIKLAGVLGMFLGFLGWGALLAGAFLGAMYGALGGIGLMMFGRAGWRTRIPYGPYLIAGALTAVFLAGPAVRGWLVVLMTSC